MSESLMSGLASQFGGDTIGQLSKLVGADEDQTARAVASALPMLVGSMAGSADSAPGVNSLFGALSNDHDGSILDDLGGLLSNSYASRVVGQDGSRILGHVFGNKQPAVEQTVSKSAGIPMDLVARLLPILAPIVMGYIGRRLRGDGLDAGGLGSVLGGEREAARQQDPGLGGLFDILGGGGAGTASDDSGGGLMDMAGDLLQGPAGRAILGQILGR
ncbi:MAG: DUF937 domain-containing protein [Acidimicrobiales bacterium]